MAPHLGLLCFFRNDPRYTLVADITHIEIFGREGASCPHAGLAFPFYKRIALDMVDPGTFTIKAFLVFYCLCHGPTSPVSILTVPMGQDMINKILDA